MNPSPHWQALMRCVCVGGGGAGSVCAPPFQAEIYKQQYAKWCLQDKSTELKGSEANRAIPFNKHTPPMDDLQRMSRGVF